MIHPISKVGPRKSVYLAVGNTLKIGVRGKATPPKEALSKLTKGERRRVRKDLVAAGHRDIVLASL